MAFALMGHVLAFPVFGLGRLVTSRFTIVQQAWRIVLGTGDVVQPTLQMPTVFGHAFVTKDLAAKHAMLCRAHVLTIALDMEFVLVVFVFVTLGLEVLLVIPPLLSRLAQITALGTAIAVKSMVNFLANARAALPEQIALKQLHSALEVVLGMVCAIVMQNVIANPGSLVMLVKKWLACAPHSIIVLVMVSVSMIHVSATLVMLVSPAILHAILGVTTVLLVVTLMKAMVHAWQLRHLLPRVFASPSMKELVAKRKPLKTFLMITSTVGILSEQLSLDCWQLL